MPLGDGRVEDIWLCGFPWLGVLLWVVLTSNAARHRIFLSFMVLFML